MANFYNEWSDGTDPFQGKDLTLPPSPFDSRQRAYKRRAYGSVEVTGNDQFTCSPKYTLTFGGDSGTKYAQGGALQPRSGGRYVPNPFLTSITTKNQGSGGIEDYSLWEVEFQYTCYGESQLNDVSNSFMIPGMLLKVIIGYDPGDRLIINDARVYDFSFSYNSDDGSYSCTTKCLGTNSAATVGGGEKVKPGYEGWGHNADGIEMRAYSAVRSLMKEASVEMNVTVDSDGNISGKGIPNQGKGYSRGHFGLINIYKPAGFWANVFSFGSADEVPVLMVDLKRLVEFFASITTVDYVFPAKYETRLYLIMSSNPYEFCFAGERGNYGGENVFKNLSGEDGVCRDSIYVSFNKLLEIEDKVMKEVKNKGGMYSVNQFLNGVFADLATCTGGAVDLFITEHNGSYIILNKKYDIYHKSKGTTIKLLDPNSPVKSLSMSSNLDPDMAAIAFSGAGGNYTQGMQNNVFGNGCRAKVGSLLSGVEDKLLNKINELGKGWTPDNAQDCKGIMREYVNGNLTEISMRYGLDLSVTMDGYSSPQFMDRFYVQPLPSGVGGGDVYFAVGEIEHKCDGETWDTTIVGYMMVNA